MADEDSKPKIDPARLDTQVGGTRVDTIDTARDPKAKTVSTDVGGAGIEFGTDGTTKRTGVEAAFDDNKDKAEEDELEADLKAGDEDDKVEDDDKGEDAPADETAPEPLPDFDPENAEVLAAYEARYFKEDGTINEDALGAIVAAKVEKGEAPELGANEYAFLEKRFGLPKVIVDDHIQGKIALQAERERAFNEALGGEAARPVKLDWAAKNYTDAQKERFKAAMQEGGEAAREQIDLLNNRFEKAGGKVPAPAKGDAAKTNLPAPPPRRPLSPQKSTAAAENPGGRAGIVPFANAEEHRKAQAAAIASGDKTKIDLVRKRVAASTFWK